MLKYEKLCPENDIESSIPEQRTYSGSASRQHLLSGFLAFVVTGIFLLTRSHDAFNPHATKLRDLAGAGFSFRVLAASQRPTLHLVGDSTMAIDGVEIGGRSRGWGESVFQFVDLPVNNKALSGRQVGRQQQRRNA